MAIEGKGNQERRGDEEREIGNESNDPSSVQTRGEFGRHFGSIFELGKFVVKCSVVW